MRERCKLAKWIKFIPNGTSPSGKTGRWSVQTVDGQHTLGEIAWYGPWRKYCFFPSVGAMAQTVFEWDCLRDIADQLQQLTKVHRENTFIDPKRV